MSVRLSVCPSLRAQSCRVGPNSSSSCCCIQLETSQLLSGSMGQRFRSGQVGSCVTASDGFFRHSSVVIDQVLVLSNIHILVVSELA